MLDRILDHYTNNADLLNSAMQPRAAGDVMTPPIPPAAEEFKVPLVPIEAGQPAPSGMTPGPSRIAPGGQVNGRSNSGDMSQMLACIQQQMLMQNRLMEQLTMLVARTQEERFIGPLVETQQQAGASGSSRTGSPSAAQGRLSGSNLVKIISP